MRTNEFQLLPLPGCTDDGYGYSDMEDYARANIEAATAQLRQQLADTQAKLDEALAREEAIGAGGVSGKIHSIRAEDVPVTPEEDDAWEALEKRSMQSKDREDSDDWEWADANLVRAEAISDAQWEVENLISETFRGYTLREAIDHARRAEGGRE